MKKLQVLSTALFLTIAFTTFNVQSAHAATVTVNEVAVEIDGTKFWLPSNITVKKGDTVKVHAVSKVPGTPSVHGFSIPAYNVTQVVDDKGKDFEFVADKAGVFPINCQLHPAHIGGQLVVTE